MRYFLGVALLLSLGLSISASPRLVLYQGGFAFVEEDFLREIVSPTASLDLVGLPKGIDLDSLSVQGLPVRGWRWVEEGPILPPAAWIGKTVEVRVGDRNFTGKLLSLAGGLLLETEEGYVLLKDYDSISCPSEPKLKGFKALRLLLSRPVAGKVEYKLSYLSEGFGWSAHYLGLWDEEKGVLSLLGIAALSNDSGREYSEATVELVAGEVHRAVPPQARALAVAAPKAYEGGLGVTEVPTAEYHRYILGEPVDLGPGITRVVYLPWTEIPAERVYRFIGDRVLFSLRFSNESGKPLPAGDVKVFGEGVFLGEDSMGHTPVGGEVELSLGAAFDLTGKRIRTGYRRLAENRYRESYRITIRSAKEEPVAVEVLEELRGDWEITNSSLPYEVLDANHVRFVLRVPAGGEAEVEYTVEYSY